MGREGGPSPEEMRLTKEETRVLSDAELIKGGARKVQGGRLEVTAEQVADAKKEMLTEQETPGMRDARVNGERMRSDMESVREALRAGDIKKAVAHMVHMEILRSQQRSLIVRLSREERSALKKQGLPLYERRGVGNQSEMNQTTEAFYKEMDQVVAEVYKAIPDGQ